MREGPRRSISGTVVLRFRVPYLRLRRPEKGRTSAPSNRIDTSPRRCYIPPATVKIVVCAKQVVDPETPVSAFKIEWGLLAVGAGMAVGGLLGARKVAHTMSKRISPLNHGQGFTANLVTAFLVIVASRFGMPVSTTHVSCGSLFGIGLSTGEGNKGVMAQILLSWILTLPCAALAAGITAWLLGNLI